MNNGFMDMFAESMNEFNPIWVLAISFCIVNIFLFLRKSEKRSDLRYKFIISIFITCTIIIIYLMYNVCKWFFNN